MKFTYRLSAALIASAVILMQPQNTAALESNEINKIAKQITVRIDGVNKGTGVIINKQGNTYTVLTNRHVIQLPGNYTLQTPDGQTYTYTFNSSQVKQLPNLDLAVFQFNSDKNYSYAKLGDSSKLTETTPIYIGGWGVKDAFCLERCYRFSEGKIISISPQSKDGYSLIYSNPVKQGMSGGPVLNAQGELVGINGNSFTDPDSGITDFAGIPINEYKKYQNIITASEPKASLTPRPSPTTIPRPTPEPKASQTPTPSPTPRNHNNISTAPVDKGDFYLANTLTGHSRLVSSVAWSPDGSTLASGSEDNTIKLWDGKTGNLLRTLSGHLASGSEDNTINLWDGTIGNLLLTLSDHSDWVRSVAWSPDGRTLASVSHDNTIKIWDIRTGNLLRTLSGHSDMVRSVAWSPDGRTLASGSHDNTIKIWDWRTGNLLRTLSGHSDMVSFVAWSPNGRTLASGSWDKTIKIWDGRTGNLLRTLSGHSDWVSSVVSSPDGRTLASSSWDKTIKIWDGRTGQLLGTLSGHYDSVLSVAWSPDGRTLASGSYDNTIKIWDGRTRNLLRTLSGHSNSVESVAWNPDGRTLASGSDDNTIKIWRLSE